MLRFSGEWLVEHRGIDGRVIEFFRLPNTMTFEGLTHALRVVFNNLPGVYPWYGGLIDGSSAISVGVSDTMAVHPGWSEFQGYSGDRQGWTGLSIAGGIAIASAPMLFTFTQAATIGGFFLSSASGKGTTSGVLWSVAKLASPRSFQAGEQYVVGYKVIASGGGAA